MPLLSVGSRQVRSIIIGAAGAVIYAEWAVSGLDEELLEGAPAEGR